MVSVGGVLHSHTPKRKEYDGTLPTSARTVTPLLRPGNCRSAATLALNRCGWARLAQSPTRLRARHRQIGPAVPRRLLCMSLFVTPKCTPTPPSPAVRFPAGVPFRAKGAIIFAAMLGMLLATDGGSTSRIGDGMPAAASGLRQGHLDRSGLKRMGMASFYASRFAGRKMADGTPMRPQGDNAASITLPLGTTALVTNLKTGRTAIVTIRDRGPYVKGRIVDLSPATARKIGIGSREGLAPVEVTPIEVPLGDGTFKVMANNAAARGTGDAPGVWDN